MVESNQDWNATTDHSIISSTDCNSINFNTSSSEFCVPVASAKYEKNSYDYRNINDFSNCEKQSLPMYSIPNNSISSISTRNIRCHRYIIEIIKLYKLDQEIAEKYNCEIQKKGLDLKFSSLDESVLNSIEDELSKVIKSLEFDDGQWQFLSENGEYINYDSEINQMIEEKYWKVYLKLKSSNYQNYSENRNFTFRSINYILEFAQIGGVHRQRRQNAESSKNFIRSVRRESVGKNVNLNYKRNYTWEWWHESDEFRSYEADAIFLIEQSYIEFISNKLDSPLVLIQGSNFKTYMIDFSRMSQFNENSKYKRAIRRIDNV